METIYKADDGTEFYDEDECRDYENELRIKNGTMPKMWNSNLDTIITNFSDFHKVFFVKIENDLQIETLRAAVDYHGFMDYPSFEIGFYYWDEDEVCWKNISERLDELHYEIAELEKIKTKMLE